MNIFWSPEAKADIRRLYLFLAQHDLDAADEVFDGLRNAPESLTEFPRRGSPLSELGPRDVREFRVGAYLLRYDSAGAIYVLRFFHGREDRL